MVTVPATMAVTEVMELSMVLSEWLLNKFERDKEKAREEAREREKAREKAREEARERLRKEVRKELREEVRKEWETWNRLRLEAKERGEPFKVPPPTGKTGIDPTSQQLKQIRTPEWGTNMVTTPSMNYLILIEDDDERHELLDGERVLVPPPNMDHQEAAAYLGTSLSMFVRAHGLGWVYFASTDVVFSDTDVVQPDLLFISNERRYIRTPANIRGAPDLIVEIMSPSSSRRDWGYKRDLYARHGVREYWIIDPTNHVVSVLALRDGVLEIDQTLTEDNTARSSVLEGFDVNLVEIFAG